MKRCILALTALAAVMSYPGAWTALKSSGAVESTCEAAGELWRFIVGASNPANYSKPIGEGWKVERVEK